MLKILLNKFIKNNYPGEKTKSKEEKILLKNYDRAIKYNPINANGYFSRGNLKFKLGSYQDAIKDYNRAVSTALPLVVRNWIYT